jgi:eukaryotic-like serine/threonine-protein kinase
MQLASGTRLGPYQIDAAIGAGGMGEVYRATDTRLDRSVAIKVLSAAFASDPALRARFEREAKAISSLSHSHICALYDVGEAAGPEGASLLYLVMEYLDGEPLDARLLKGPLPTEQVLRIGGEIAEALDKAHRSGIIHRDLKPGNVMLTRSGAKLLDFGLARTVAAPEQVESEATVHRPLTQEGTLVGTFQYMSPEQLEGQPADARSDLFALGAILYEMVTGRRAFEGKSRASVIAAILESDVTPISEIRPMVPPALDRVIRVCLAKDPEERWQTAHDVMLQLRWIAEGGSKAGVAGAVTRRRVAREWVAWTVAALTALVAVAYAVAYLRRTPAAASMVHFSIETPERASLFPFDERGIALSPDGSRLAFVAATEDGRRVIFVRPLRSNSAEALAGTEDASYPFWSPDGQSIGFFARGKLMKIDSAGGPPQAICDASSGRGGTWNDQGTILFEPTIQSPLFRVAAAGGTPTRVTVLTPSDTHHRWPSFLPDGKHFLFVAGEKDVYVGSLDSREIRKLISDGSNAAFAPPDRVVFSRATILMTQKFDLRHLTVEGDPVALPFGSVSYWAAKRLSIFSVAANGTLAFLPATSRISRIVWIDRNGHEAGSVGEPGSYLDAALSPDGTKIALIKGDVTEGDIWLVDVSDDRWSRFTFHPGGYSNLTWSRDGSTLAYMYVPGTIGQTYVKTLGRDDEARAVVRTEGYTLPYSFAPDGRVLLIGRQMPATGFDIFSVSLDGKAEMHPIVQTPFAESHARFSPDGKWFAYDSNESGRTEVYARRFPPTSDEWQVSSNGGASPLWSGDGHELYYIGSQSLMAVPVGGGERLNPGTPRALFHVTNSASSLSTAGSIGSLICGVTPDGGKFLFRSTSDERTASINVVLNWQSELREARK